MRISSPSFLKPKGSRWCRAHPLGLVQPFESRMRPQPRRYSRLANASSGFAPTCGEAVEVTASQRLGIGADCSGRREIACVVAYDTAYVMSYIESGAADFAKAQIRPTACKPLSPHAGEGRRGTELRGSSCENSLNL